jgi:hypothetical protein
MERWKKIEAVSIDGSMDSQDAAHDINCIACCSGFTYAKNESELSTFKRFFEKQIALYSKSIRDGLQLVITDVDSSDVVR